jgi:hypothetical protein
MAELIGVSVAQLRDVSLAWPTPPRNNSLVPTKAQGVWQMDC